MSNRTYMLAQMLSNFVFITLFLLLGLIVYSFKFDLKVIEIQIFLISVLFSFGLISFNLFMSLFFKNPVLASDISNMICFVINLIAIVLTMINSEYLFLFKVIPNTPYYIIIKKLVVRDNELGFEYIRGNVILLVIQVFVYSYLYYVFDKLLEDDNGMNKDITQVLLEFKDRLFQKEELQQELLTETSIENQRSDAPLGDPRPEEEVRREGGHRQLQLQVREGGGVLHHGQQRRGQDQLAEPHRGHLPEDQGLDPLRERVDTGALARVRDRLQRGQQHLDEDAHRVPAPLHLLPGEGAR